MSSLLKINEGLGNSLSFFRNMEGRRQRSLQLIGQITTSEAAAGTLHSAVVEPAPQYSPKGSLRLLRPEYGATRLINQKMK